MNRRERRALERAGKLPKKEPVYAMKPSQMAQAAMKGPGKPLVDAEIRKFLLDQDKSFCIDMDTMVLWTLHKKRGWAYARLKQFYLDMFSEHIRMRKFYEIGDLYPERHKLKEIGVDVEAWYNCLFDENGNFKNPEEVELP